MNVKSAWLWGVTAIVAGLGGLVPAGGAVAQEHRGPVVVELYTSQGCSACPPADEMLHRLAERSDVIALALHVDYWDYIGWKDVFARPEHAERQRGFAASAGEKMIYTPQMVIDGVSHVIGNRPMDVTDAVMEHAETPDPVRVRLTRDGRELRIDARGDVDAPVEVHLVRVSGVQSVEITRGENRGRTISYTNVVQDWSVLTTWDGDGPLRLKAQLPWDGPLAVLVQRPNHGAILGAAALR